MDWVSSQWGRSTERDEHEGNMLKDDLRLFEPVVINHHGVPMETDTLSVRCVRAVFTKVNFVFQLT
jgi:hypothetical protein